MARNQHHQLVIAYCPSSVTADPLFHPEAPFVQSNTADVLSFPGSVRSLDFEPNRRRWSLVAGRILSVLLLGRMISTQPKTLLMSLIPPTLISRPVLERV